MGKVIHTTWCFWIFVDNTVRVSGTELPSSSALSCNRHACSHRSRSTRDFLRAVACTSSAQADGGSNVVCRMELFVLGALRILGTGSGCHQPLVYGGKELWSKDVDGTLLEQMDCLGRYLTSRESSSCKKHVAVKVIICKCSRVIQKLHNHNL